MTTRKKPPVLVILQLTGGNDYMNTVVPYQDGNYYDNRPNIHVSQNDALKLDEGLALNPSMGPLKEIYDRGDMAVFNGVGWENSDRSHFRCMDIWHTAEPDKIGAEGWLGQAIRQIDPDSENPVTAVNLGPGLPRALVAEGVSVAAVADLASYGLLTSVEQEDRRTRMLDRFARMHSPVVGSGPIMDFLAQTGQAALKGADMLKTAPERYSSSVEYAATSIAKNLHDVAMIHTARTWNEDLLHGARRVRHSRRPGRQSSEAVDADLRGCRRLLGRPSGARRR